MKTDLILYPKKNEINRPETLVTPSSISWGKKNKSQSKPAEILFITSFPPRECGIATYSQDLVNALNNQFEGSFSFPICALESNNEQHIYPEQPKFILNTDSGNSFRKTAFQINKDDNIQLVVVQHEFGFFAKKEIEYQLFINSITKPIVFVFHTVLPNPHKDLKTRVQDMATIASSIIVMTIHAAQILIEEYHVAAHKISVIPHGTHLIEPSDQEEIKKRYHLSNRKVLSTFGLLSSSKNIETTLKALPLIIKKHPEVIFLILGKTHPSVLKQEGEHYRAMLETMVENLHIQPYVQFENKYLTLQNLLEYLQLTDIYLFTSKDPNQAVSGTFSYAVSCGCPVVSTPIPHAKEVLSFNNGIIIDFENSTQLSEAVILLLDDDVLRQEISFNSFQKMSSTVWQNAAIAHALLFEKLGGHTVQLEYKIPDVNLNHIIKMTTNVGIAQFAKFSIPDRTSGYTLDDNARALIATCQYYEIFQNNDVYYLINTYLEFISHCLQPEGFFLNYTDPFNEFTFQNSLENLDDSNGRAIWALGYLISLKKILPTYLSEKAENLLTMALPNLHNIYSTRAMAFIIKGLCYANHTETHYLIQLFSNRLVQMYRHEKTEHWHWFEDCLTYGNSALPEALLYAYVSTNNLDYKKIAIESFHFLLSKIFIDGKIKVISNKGWLKKDSITEAVVGGEQPIDVAYTVMALAKFHAVFQLEEYQEKAKTAFSWFLGNNHLHQIVYNPRTGGCYDGVEEYNVNLNQGAESTLSYLLARLSIQSVLKKG